MEDAQDLDRIADQAVRHDERRPRDHELACSRNSAGSPDFRVVGKQRFNILDDMKRKALESATGPHPTQPAKALPSGLIEWLESL